MRHFFFERWIAQRYLSIGEEESECEPQRFPFAKSPGRSPTSGWRDSLTQVTGVNTCEGFQCLDDAKPSQDVVYMRGPKTSGLPRIGVERLRARRVPRRDREALGHSVASGPLPLTVSRSRALRPLGLDIR